MDAKTKQGTAATPPRDGRVPRPVLARRPANPRSHEDIIADAKKRHADALAYLAAR